MTQTVREMKIDVAIIADPYIMLNTQVWVTYTTGEAVIWSCNIRSFGDQPDTKHSGFVRAKLGNVNLPT